MPRQIEEEVKTLLALYLEHFAGAVPSTSESASFHLRAVLRETLYENIEPLVIEVAKSGMILTRNTLVIARNKRLAPPSKPTPTPPPYQEPDYTGAVPMPSWVREQVMEAIRKNREK